jgi:hypothetical protein
LIWDVRRSVDAIAQDPLQLAEAALFAIDFGHIADESVTKVPLQQRPEGGLQMADGGRRSAGLQLRVSFNLSQLGPCKSSQLPRGAPLDRQLAQALFRDTAAPFCSSNQ